MLYQIVYGHPPFAHLEPMQRVLELNNPDMKISFPPGHCLECHAEATKSQLLDVLERCLQRDPRKRPSTNDLLVHPFLASVAQVQRQQVDVAVSSLMDRVARLLGKSLDSPEIVNSLPAESWQALADEVWEQISKSDEDQGDSNSNARDFMDSRSLAPLNAITSRLSTLRQERDALVEQARRQKQRSVTSQQESQHHGHQQQRCGTKEQSVTSKGLFPREEKVPARDKENAPPPANTNSTIQRLQAAKKRDLQNLDQSSQASRGIW
jgi:serine/threonine protein kinase